MAAAVSRVGTYLLSRLAALVACRGSHSENQSETALPLSSLQKTLTAAAEGTNQALEQAPAFEALRLNESKLICASGIKEVFRVLSRASLMRDALLSPRCQLTVRTQACTYERRMRRIVKRLPAMHVARFLC